ncbi:hypothetical protein PVAP13_9NG426000 [Panicum virgatum]|uniref:Uncharacterized protein n=1 Tax=Panicum virgatum TaxID=38727 RepID=A0A8T0MN97_PANVG|nr:hypothetical protein PVAP13_9NG426000 [Panicum virgatum]
MRPLAHPQPSEPAPRRCSCPARSPAVLAHPKCSAAGAPPYRRSCSSAANPDCGEPQRVTTMAAPSSEDTSFPNGGTLRGPAPAAHWISASMWCRSRLAEAMAHRSRWRRPLGAHTSSPGSARELAGGRAHAAASSSLPGGPDPPDSVAAAFPSAPDPSAMADPWWSSEERRGERTGSGGRAQQVTVVRRGMCARQGLRERCGTLLRHKRRAEAWPRRVGLGACGWRNGSPRRAALHGVFPSGRGRIRAGQCWRRDRPRHGGRWR